MFPASRFPAPRRGEARRARRHLAKARLNLELLEQRLVLDVRSITGFGNNLAHPAFGQSGTDLLRKSLVRYADGVSAPSLPDNPGARFLSNALNDQSDPPGGSGATDISTPNSQHLSDFAYLWGQFIDHDMDLTTATSGESFPIPPGSSDDPMGTEPFTRSTFDPATGTGPGNPRQQVNADTSFLDLSQVYGSTDVVANALRTHSGGHLKTSPGGFLPFNSTAYFTADQIAALNLANDAMQVPAESLYATGDVRGNENIELTALQTLFVRNHNLYADELRLLNPRWTDEQLYQEARKLNIAVEEMITYNEFLPAILGPNALPRYTGYRAGVNPGISTEFSTVGFRFGHSLLSGEVGRHNNDGTEVADAPGYPGSGGGVDLAAGFFDPYLIGPNGAVDPLTGKVSTGIGAILKADADGAANEFDRYLISQIRNELFGIPDAPGTDLAARDVQRARDHGIGTYNDVRAGYGLPRVTSFAQITSDPANQAALAAAYGNDVNQVDAFEGILFEDHVPGGDVGPTTKAILVDQFARLRDGDRFFYLNENFNFTELALLLQGNTLDQVIENNTQITNLQGNVFFFRADIAGAVFNDPDGDGVRQGGEAGLAGVPVYLLDDGGSVVASTVTDANGGYDFTDTTGIPGTGDFTVAVDLSGIGYVQNAAQLAHNPGVIHVSRGGLDFRNQNFAAMSPTGPGGGQRELGVALADLSDGTAVPPAVTPATSLGASSSEVDPRMAATATGTTSPAGTVEGESAVVRAADADGAAQAVTDLFASGDWLSPL